MNSDILYNVHICVCLLIATDEEGAKVPASLPEKLGNMDK